MCAAMVSSMAGISFYKPKIVLNILKIWHCHSHFQNAKSLFHKFLELCIIEIILKKICIYIVHQLENGNKTCKKFNLLVRLKNSS
jgi:hypothetical protein